MPLTRHCIRRRMSRPSNQCERFVKTPESRYQLIIYDLALGHAAQSLRYRRNIRVFMVINQYGDLTLSAVLL